MDNIIIEHTKDGVFDDENVKYFLKMACRIDRLENFIIKFSYKYIKYFINICVIAPSYGVFGYVKDCNSNIVAEIIYDNNFTKIKERSSNIIRYENYKINKKLKLYNIKLHHKSYFESIIFNKIYIDANNFISNIFNYNENNSSDIIL